jgi:hypothetical protein
MIFTNPLEAVLAQRYGLLLLDFLNHFIYPPLSYAVRRARQC